MSINRNQVLVVDDDAGMLRAIKRLLQQNDYEPILFSSAQAFKSHADFGMAICVILDINLDDGSGIELRHGLNDAGISVPVIYMTGNDDPAVRRAAVASGCIAFLTKPFSTQSLIEPLKKASGGPLRTAGAVNIPLTDWEDYRSRPWRDTVLQEEPSPFPKLR